MAATNETYYRRYLDDPLNQQSGTPPISEIVTGPPGPQGPQGVTGSQGPPGTNGINGTNGAISEIENQGSPLTVRPTLNFTGAGVVASDNSANNRTDITISGGGSGGAVSSVFTRTGAVVATSGDYTAAQVTNAVDKTQSYVNPAWITSLPYSKLTGAPTTASLQTPWVTNINGAGFNLSGANAIAATQVSVNTTDTSVPLVVGGPDADPATSLGSFMVEGGDTSHQIRFGFNKTNTNGWITCNGGYALTLNPVGGRVGVGTETPGSLLDVKQVANTNAGGLRFTRSDATNYGELYIGGDNTLYLQNNSGPYIAFTSAGNLGVGTSGPAALLHVSGSSGTATIIESSSTGVYAQFRLSGTSKGYVGYIPLGSGGMGFLNSSGSVANLLVTDAGNVGIGTSSPSGGLQINTVAPQIVITTPGDANTYQISRDTGNGALRFQGSEGPGSVTSQFDFWANSPGGPLKIFTIDNNGHVFIYYLPSSNPGAGTKQLWYDPADSNRVKFAV